jgi:hypothetical protein
VIGLNRRPFAKAVYVELGSLGGEPGLGHVTTCSKSWDRELTCWWQMPTTRLIPRC